MYNHIFDISQNDVVELTNKLERLHKSDMPLAVRQTLNDAAFEARKESIKLFRKNFIIRKPTFIRTHIIVNKSINTFDIDQMVSEAGIPEGKTGDNLKKQEFGGNISHRDIPTTEARIGGNKKALVSKGYYKKVWHNKPNGRIYRSGESTIIKTDRYLYRILRGSIWKIIYVLDRDISIEEKPFLAPAGKIVASRIPTIFGKNAKKRIKKYWNKK